MKKNCDTCKWGDYPIEFKDVPCKICCAGSNYESKPTTNADRIRAMSDEELALYFKNITCPYRCGAKVNCDIDNKGCWLCWLDWLKQEENNED